MEPMLSWRRSDLEALPDRLTSAGFTVRRCAIEPPCPAPTEIDGISVPAALAALWEHEAGAVEIAYFASSYSLGTTAIADLVGATDVHGGPTLLSPDWAQGARLASLDWAESVVGGDIPESSRRSWLESVPFVSMRNGDYLAFSPQGEVVYLAHDDESFVLSASFEAFLRDWSAVGFIGPEWWMLQPFSDGDRRLRADQPTSVELNRAFTKLLDS